MNRMLQPTELYRHIFSLHLNGALLLYPQMPLLSTHIFKKICSFLRFSIYLHRCVEIWDFLSFCGKNSPSLAALASPLQDGAFGIATKFPSKVQSLRTRQRLPPRGSWQNRQVLTEGVSSCEKNHNFWKRRRAKTENQHHCLLQRTKESTKPLKNFLIFGAFVGRFAFTLLPESAIIVYKQQCLLWGSPVPAGILPRAKGTKF